MPSSCQRDAQGLLELLGGRARDEVDRVADGRVARDERAQRVLGRLAQLGHLETGARARVGREDPGTARVADDRDAPTGGNRLVREQHRGGQELVERVDADHARLAEERVDRDIGRCQRRRVRRRRAGRPPSVRS